MQGRTKKLIQINTVCNTSTGRIMGDIQREAIRQGYETLSIVGRRQPFKDIPCVKIGNGIAFWTHVIINTVFDRQGYASWYETCKIVKRLRKEKPDIIHLHNLHGYYLNLPMLFSYLKKEFKGKIFWTFHDCWPFTGHCAYFTLAQCEKWKEHCHHCPNKKNYPVSWFADNSESNYRDKKEMFTELSDMTIIVPSKWMADLVKQSFMKEYPLEVVSNGIDTELFSCVKKKEIYDKYGIPKDKKILLGVANIWEERKGLQDFLNLSQKISDEYVIVLVGLSKMQIRKVPDNVIGIERTENQSELVALYSTAHIFINPSVEESFSLVTVEAMACGTPAIVLNTSAVQELVLAENGVVLKSHGAEDYIKAIKHLEALNLDRATIARSTKKYDKMRAATSVLDLYEERC